MSTNIIETQVNTQKLVKDLAEVINRHSLESLSNTPDFILANYLVSCILSLGVIVRDRSKWHGHHEEPALYDRCQPYTGVPECKP